MSVVKYFRIPRPVKHVKSKEAAEKQNLGEQKNPHPDFSRFPLLVNIAEMML
jgi:hypothetical protein